MGCLWPANTCGYLSRSFSNSPPRPRRIAGVGSDLSWQYAGNIRIISHSSEPVVVAVRRQVVALIRRLSGRDLHVSLVFMSLCCKKHMHTRMAVQATEQQGKGNMQHTLPSCPPPLLRETSCDGMQPARLKHTTSHLAPHLGGVAASIGTLNRVGAYTWARACASPLQTCLNQYVDRASL